MEMHRTLKAKTEKEKGREHIQPDIKVHKTRAVKTVQYLIPI